MNRSLLLIFLFQICWITTYSQNAVAVELLERIAFHADVMVNADDSRHRIKAHDIMSADIDSLLAIPGCEDLPLDSIKWISTVRGDDFRIVTWQLRIHDNEYKYGGFYQSGDKVIRLKDNRPWLNGSLRSQYSFTTWYGALYYQIIPFGPRHDTYILFGFNAEDSKVNTKVVDVLDLSGDEPKLGMPVFTGRDEPQNRLILTYADVSSVQLFYDPDLKAVVHDHLISLEGVGPAGEALLVSDGSQEGWLLKNNTWTYKEKMYDVKSETPPMSDERKDRKEDKDILGRPKKP